MYGNICYDTRDQYVNFPWSSEDKVDARSANAGRFRLGWTGRLLREDRDDDGIVRRSRDGHPEALVRARSPFRHEGARRGVGPHRPGARCRRARRPLLRF